MSDLFGLHPDSYAEALQREAEVDPPPLLPARIAGLALSTALVAFAAGVMVARNLEKEPQG